MGRKESNQTKQKTHWYEKQRVNFPTSVQWPHRCYLKNSWKLTPVLNWSQSLFYLYWEVLLNIVFLYTGDAIRSSIHSSFTDFCLCLFCCFTSQLIATVMSRRFTEKDRTPYWHQFYWYTTVPLWPLGTCIQIFTISIEVMPRSFSSHYHFISKTCVKRPLKNRQNKDLNDKW